jgi:nucleotide sugar dehydrogenase
MRKNIEEIMVNPDIAIKEVMKKINAISKLGLPSGIALIANEEKQLLGIVTDGDIRRAIIRGIDINNKISEIMVKDPITVLSSMNPNSMLKVINNQVSKAIKKKRLHQRKVDKIVVVDKDNKIVDVLTFFEIWRRSDIRLKNVCIVGMGFVGLTLAVSLADIGFNVLGVDENANMLKEISAGRPPFHEKNLDYFLKRNLNKNLFLSRDLVPDDNDIYIICVGTPLGDNNKPNLASVKAASINVGSSLKEGDLIILRSTVPVGICRNVILPILEKESNLICGKDFYLAFAPERVVEGKALEELRSLPQIIGGYTKLCLDIASNFFRSLSPNIVAVDSLEEAEMAKLLNNSFRDVSFAFANELVFICDHFNLNASKIIKAASEGYSRNKLPFPGFVGGYCLKKDPYIYANVAEEFNVISNLAIISREINNKLPSYTLSKIEKFSQENNKNKNSSKIFVLGFAFKGVPETSDMRDSPTLDLIKLLRDKDWKNIYGFDPNVKKDDIESTGVINCSLEVGFKDADIIVIMNNNPLYSELDIVTLLNHTNKKCLLFDGWSIFEPKEVLKVKGIVYQGLGFRKESD